MTTPLMVVVTWSVVVTVSVVSLPPELLLETVQKPEPTVSVRPSQLTVPSMAERSEWSETR